MPETKKLLFPSELAYILALVIQALAVAFVGVADLGFSMVVAPAYLLSLKIEALTFGTAEYLTEMVVFILMCILVRRFKVSYLISVISLLIYGAALDFWRKVIPFLNPSITTPGSFAFPIRLLIFIGGMLVIQFTIALSFKTYLTPLVVDYFVKEVSDHFAWSRSKFKSIFDVTFFVTSVVMSLLFFGRITAIGVGTVIQVICNGPCVGFFDKALDRLFEFKPVSPKLEKYC